MGGVRDTILALSMGMLSYYCLWSNFVQIAPPIAYSCLVPIIKKWSKPRSLESGGLLTSYVKLLSSL